METAIQKGEHQWKDLELALGKLTAELGNDVEGFRDFYQDEAIAQDHLLTACTFLPRKSGSLG